MPIDFTTALAKLLANPQLRLAFRNNAQQVARELDVEDSHVKLFCELDPNELDEQAETLIGKRQFEVAQLVPLTWENLGDDAPRLFRDFAVEFWPDGHLRHQLDAFEFCKRLRQQRNRNLSKSEWNWLKFSQGRAWLRIHFVTNFRLHDRRYMGLQVLYRRRGEPRSYVLGLPLHT